ncbi:hypothetical protein Q1695_016197 [Nippostrongylus brasiliensis]|nr:hypothetical protein Q1695_016197 [Nippostrongylus brasiliensis]
MSRLRLVERKTKKTCDDKGPIYRYIPYCRIPDGPVQFAACLLPRVLSEGSDENVSVRAETGKETSRSPYQERKTSTVKYLSYPAEPEAGLTALVDLTAMGIGSPNTRSLSIGPPSDANGRFSRPFLHLYASSAPTRAMRRRSRPNDVEVHY